MHYIIATHTWKNQLIKRKKAPQSYFWILECYGSYSFHAMVNLSMDSYTSDNALQMFLEAIFT